MQVVSKDSQPYNFKILVKATMKYYSFTYHIGGDKKKKNSSVQLWWGRKKQEASFHFSRNKMVTHLEIHMVRAVKN